MTEPARHDWERERRREALGMIWEWDPLGIIGVADSYYDALAATAVAALADGCEMDAVADALRVGVLGMASLEGFSQAAAERNTQPAGADASR